MDQTTPEQDKTPAATRTIAVVGGAIDSRDLFAGGREVQIRHQDAVYRLRLTSQNKLILTK